MNNVNFPKEEAIKIKIMDVTQPIGTFYVGIAKATDVIQICSADVRRREKDKLEEYIGMQRELRLSRVKEIKKFVKTWDAAFPNSIILAVNKGCYFFDDDFIYIKRDKKSSNIIDGQHRLAGFDGNIGENFDIILTLFPGLPFEEQAYLFSVINTKMRVINPSLAMDLFTFSKVDTPEKLVHSIAISFNKDLENPWYKKIKMLGKKETGDAESVLSQSTFIKYILNIIYDWEKDYYQVRDKLKRNNNNRRKLINFYNEKKSNKYMFWEPYIKGEDDFIIAVLRDYFIAVKKTFPDSWEDTTKILTKTTGYIAMMNIFNKLLKKGFGDKDLTKRFFINYMEKAKNSVLIKEFTSDNYPPGGLGERELIRDFTRAMDL